MAVPTYVTASAGIAGAIGLGHYVGPLLGDYPIMDKLTLVLAVFSFVCFVIAAAPLGAPYWNRLVAAGLAFFVAIFIFGSGLRLFG